MVRPDFEKWNQTAEDIWRLSLEADHVRSRERFQALYMIDSGQSNASQGAKRINRRKQTVLSWVHHYNEGGPEGIPYQATGGPPAKLNDAEKKRASPRSPRTAPGTISGRAMAGP